MTDDYLGTMNVDNLGRMVLALLTEHWILRDRFAILEALMIEHGVLAPGLLDDYIPSAEMAVQLAALRERTASAVIGAPLSAEARSVADILARAGLGKTGDIKPTA